MKINYFSGHYTMEKYLLYPFDNSGLQNKIFDGPFGFLRDHLKKMDIDLQTYDLGDIQSADKILFFDHQSARLDQCLKFGRKKEDLVLFLFEPEVVMPEQYRPSVWNYYGKIFTYRDDFVDGKAFVKMRYPQGQKIIPSLPSFSERNFLVLINANKYSYVRHELYSFRRNAIRYFEKQKNFTLFGFGWDRNNAINPQVAISALKSLKIFRYCADVMDSLAPYLSYKGIIEDKYSTLAKYKFCLCFENEEKVMGWISEKIFDCFFTGTIPIYLGAQNIDEYIPPECYIDMRKFRNFQELDSHLKTINEADFLNMQKAGQEFIRSDKFAKWQPESVFRNIANALQF